MQLYMITNYDLRLHLMTCYNIFSVMIRHFMIFFRSQKRISGTIFLAAETH